MDTNPMAGFSVGESYPGQEPMQGMTLAQIQTFTRVEGDPVPEEVIEEAAEGEGMGFGLDSGDGGEEC